MTSALFTMFSFTKNSAGDENTIKVTVTRFLVTSMVYEQRATSFLVFYCCRL